MPDASASEPDAGLPITSESEILRRCAELGAGVPYPGTIEASIAQINALPKPVTIACYIASLPRPLSIVATDSIFSAQPAVGHRSPRLFILGDPLILSIVPAGTGRQLLEFGELRPGHRSIKAEVEFPVYQDIEPAAPYDRVLFAEQVTSCGLCHREEWPSMERPGAFESMAFRPQPETDVRLSIVREHHATCVPTDEPFRCELLDAVFGLGPVEQGEFPNEMATFF